MDKQIITFSANEQNLVRIGGEYHYSSNKVSYIGAHFDLGANWDGFDSVRAVWFTDRINGISTVLDGEGNCTVPTEVLKKKDRVFVNLVGSIVSNGELTDRLTTYPAVALVVDSKAKVDSTETAPVTPSQFEQFVSIVQDAVANIKDIVSTTLNADYTLTFVYSDGTSYTTPSIRGERGPQGADGADGTDGNGIASAVLNSNYTLTLTFTDGTSYTTPSIRGAQGPKGDPGDVSQAQLDAAVSDLKSELTKLANLNVYGIAPKIKGKIINSDGSYTSNSYADILIYRVPDNAVRVSAYNGITVGGVLYQSASLFAFCDENDQLIQFVNGQSYPTGMVTLLIPNGTYYIKVVQSNQTDDKNNVFVGFDTEMRQILNSIIENYLDENVLTVGYYIDNTGTNILDGAHNWWYTDFIEVSKGYINYKGIGLSNSSVVSFYDSSQNWIGSTLGEGFDAYTKGSVIVPDNAKYVRYCSLKNGSYSTLDVTDMEFNFTAYTPAIDTNPEFKNITWLAIGDSITYGDTVNGYAYPNYIEDSTEVTLSKEGHSGYSMGALYNMRSQFIASCDIATVFAGTNDFNNNIPLGTINDNTTNTFYGVVNLMMQYMQSTYNNAPVIFFTPIWRNYNGSGSGVIVGMVNNNGDNLKDFAEAIVACGKKHGVPVIDLCNDSGIGEYNITGLTSDGVHPNARGQKVLAGIFKSVLHKYADYLD